MSAPARLLRLLGLAGAAAFAGAAVRAADAPTAAAVDPAPAPPVTAVAPAAPAPDSVAGGAHVERVQITDAYIELHTFPGRGYPVFHVAARGDWIAIVLRHTDWYKVRTADGKEGWVQRGQLASTLTQGGGAPDFHVPGQDDYLGRRVELGAGAGRFHDEPMMKLWLGWRFTDTLSLEWTVAQVQGVYSGTGLWHVNLQAEPWSDHRFSPFAGIGVGRFENVPNQSLVAFGVTNARLSDAIIGARYHLTDRFVLRADFAVYTAFVSDAQTTSYRAATAGLSFFF